mgnify:CR=1 FL=1
MPTYQYVNGTIELSSLNADKTIQLFKQFKKLLKNKQPELKLTQQHIDFKNQHKTVLVKIQGSGFRNFLKITDLTKKIKSDLAPFSIDFNLNTWEESDVIYYIRTKQKVTNKNNSLKIETLIEYKNQYPASTENLRELIDLEEAINLSDTKTFINYLTEFYEKCETRYIKKYLKSAEQEQLRDLIDILQLESEKDKKATTELLNKTFKKLSTNEFCQHYDEFLDNLYEHKIVETLLDVFDSK